MKPRKALRIVDCTKVWCGSLILFSLLTIGAVSLSAIALQQVSWTYGARIYKKSEEMGSTPYKHHLDGNGGVIELTLPNDLTSYIGNGEYYVVALTAAAHRVRIETGALGTSWNSMGDKIATLNAVKGSLLKFYVVDKDTIRVTFPDDTTFS